MLAAIVAMFALLQDMGGELLRHEGGDNRDDPPIDWRKEEQRHHLQPDGVSRPIPRDGRPPHEPLCEIRSESLDGDED